MELREMAEDRSCDHTPTAWIRPSGSEQPWHASAGRARATLFDDRPLGLDAEVIHSVAATAGQDGERWGGAACRVEGTHGGAAERT